MSITSVVKKDSGAWDIYRDSPSSYVDVYLDGDLLYENINTDPIEIIWDGTGPPEVEIVSTGSTVALSQIFSPVVSLQWRAVDTADFYSIREYVGSAWVERDRIFSDGRGYYTWKSERNNDGEQKQYRVVPISGGVESTVSAISCQVMCPPKTPEITVSVSAGNLVIEVVS